MTNAAPAVGLLWTPGVGAAVVLDRSAPRWRFTLTDGLDAMSPMRVTSELVPFVAGVAFDVPIGNIRPLLLYGRIWADNPEDYRTAVEALVGAFDPTRGTGRLTVTNEHGAQRYVNAQPRTMVWEVRHRPMVRLVSIKLDADPFWRAVDAYGGAWTLDRGLFLNDGLFLDMGSGPIVIHPTTDPFGYSWSTLGSTFTRDATVQIDGPSSGPVSIVNADGIGFSYPKLNAGQTLSVDAGERTATIGSSSVRPSLGLMPPNQHGEFFRIRPRAESLTIAGKPATVRVIYQPTFI